MKGVPAAPDKSLPVPLYPRLMGTAWAEVDEAVRQAHLDGGLLSQAGLFRVQRGTSKLARLLLAVLRLPLAAEAVTIKLVVTPLGGGERWVRSFGDRTLVTTQAAGTGGVLIERMGVVELRFRLEAAGRALIYRQTGAALRLGPLSVPFPEWLWPRVEAREEAGGLNRTHVSVVVKVPLAGLLISYSGHLCKEDPA